MRVSFYPSIFCVIFGTVNLWAIGGKIKRIETAYPLNERYLSNIVGKWMLRRTVTITSKILGTFFRIMTVILKVINQRNFGKKRRWKRGKPVKSKRVKIKFPIILVVSQFWLLPLSFVNFIWLVEDLYNNIWKDKIWARVFSFEWYQTMGCQHNGWRIWWLLNGLNFD